MLVFPCTAKKLDERRQYERADEIGYGVNGVLVCTPCLTSVTLTFELMGRAYIPRRAGRIPQTLKSGSARRDVLDRGQGEHM